MLGILAFSFIENISIVLLVTTESKCFQYNALCNSLGIEIAKCVQGKQETKLLKEFKEILHHDKEILEKVEGLKKKVVDFASSFPMPGHDEI